MTRYQRDPLDRIADRIEYARISHVASTTATSPNTNVTVARPAGTTGGDVIVASISANASLGSLSPGAVSLPAGWALIADRTNGTGRAFVAWHLADTADPANWTFTVATAATTAALSTYRNVEARRPITAVASAATTLGSSHPLPSVPAATDAVQVIHVAGFALGTTATATSGDSSRAQTTSGPSLLVSDRYQPQPGTVPAGTVATPLPQNSVTFSVALAPRVTTGNTPISHVNTTNAARTTADNVTVNRPTGTQPGDTIVASITAQGAITPGAVAAAGWNLIGDSSSTGALASARTYVLFRYATATDPASWTFQAPNATDIVAALSTYRGPDGQWPLDAVAVNTPAGATSHPFPAVTTNTNDHYLVHVLGVEANTAITAPNGTTQRANTSIGLSVTGASLLVADRPMPTAGTSTVLNATTAAAANSMSFTIALLPATMTARYGYSGHSDNAQFILHRTGAVAEGYIALPGGATYIQTPLGVRLSRRAWNLRWRSPA